MSTIQPARRAAGALLGLLVFVTVAAAQTRQGRPPGARPGPRPPGELAEDVRQAMEQTVIARMKVALHLTEDQEATVIPRVRELMQARREHATRRQAALARLRSLLLDETARDQEIGRALRDVRSIEDDFRGREEALRQTIDRDLTPRQQARMVFFEARLRRVMQRRLQETMGDGPGPGPGRGPGRTTGRRPGPAGPPIEDGPDGSDEPEDDP